MRHQKLKKTDSSSSSSSSGTSIKRSGKISKKKLEKYLAKPLKCSHIKLEINAKQIEDDLMILNLMSNNCEGSCDDASGTGEEIESLLLNKETDFMQSIDGGELVLNEIINESLSNDSSSTSSSSALSDNSAGGSSKINEKKKSDSILNILRDQTKRKKLYQMQQSTNYKNLLIIRTSTATSTSLSSNDNINNLKNNDYINNFLNHFFNE